MKNALLLALFMFVGLNLAIGQWTSHGNGTVYTMHDLLEASQGCVTYEDTLSGIQLSALCNGKQRHTQLLQLIN